MTDKTEDRIHTRQDTDWNDYVLSQLREDEMIEGSPTVSGLRRLTELLIGEIRTSQCHVFCCPTNDNRIAVVKHTIQIIDSNGQYKLYEGVADCHRHNTDAPYSAYLVATADTRAEGRALRSMLGIKKAVAEELSKDPQPEADIGSGVENITSIQEKTIKALCLRMKLDLDKYINSGKGKFESIKDVDYSSAQGMIQQLNLYQQNDDKIPTDIRVSV